MGPKADQRKERLVPQKEDSELVQAAISGDADSFTELCRRYYPAMVAIAHSILGDRDLAEDAAQQAFANAVPKLPQLRRKNRFAKWLAAICRNAALKLHRNKQKAKTLSNISQMDRLGRDSSHNDEAEAVGRAIAGLPASAREVIFLRYYDGMTYEKMSAVLGISEQAVNGRLRRARKIIKQYLSRNGFGEV